MAQQKSVWNGRSVVPPPEIEEIKKRESLEAVYPLDYVGTLFAFLEETGSANVNSVLYFNFRADLKCALSEDEISKTGTCRFHPAPFTSLWLREGSSRQKMADHSKRNGSDCLVQRYPFYGRQYKGALLLRLFPGDG